MTPLDDGMARVTAVLRGIDALALMNSLRTRAESLRAAGAKDSPPALEADLLVEDTLRAVQPDDDTGDDSAVDDTAADDATASDERPRLRPGLDIGIVISDTALWGPEDDTETAILEGYGTIPAHIVRDTLLGRPPGHLRASEEEKHPDEAVSAFFRRLYRSPRTSELIAMESRARTFPAGLSRMIRWRDSTCRTPWCNARIRHSDHVVPHHRGGPTSYANGQGLCARCNYLKEHGLWVLTPLSRPGLHADRPEESRPDPSAPPGAWVWTSPHGAVGTSITPPLLTPWPDPPSEEENPDDHGPPGPESAQ